MAMPGKESGQPGRALNWYASPKADAEHTDGLLSC